MFQVLKSDRDPICDTCLFGFRYANRVRHDCELGWCATKINNDTGEALSGNENRLVVKPYFIESPQDQLNAEIGKEVTFKCRFGGEIKRFEWYRTDNGKWPISKVASFFIIIRK